MELTLSIILKNTDPFEEEAYPLPAGYLKRFQAVKIDPLGIPEYKIPTFWDLVHRHGYKNFRNDVDYLRGKMGLPPLDKLNMEAAWFQLLEAKYRLYDARLLKKNTLEEKIMLKKRLFMTAMNQVCSS